MRHALLFASLCSSALAWAEAREADCKTREWKQLAGAVASYCAKPRHDECWSLVDDFRRCRAVEAIMVDGEGDVRHVSFLNGHGGPSVDFRLAAGVWQVTRIYWVDLHQRPNF
jgi:hypothetical protein